MVLQLNCNFSDAQLVPEDCLLVWGGLTHSLELGRGSLLEFLQRSIHPVLVVGRLKVLRKEHPWGAAAQQLRLTFSQWSKLCLSAFSMLNAYYVPASL